MPRASVPAKNDGICTGDYNSIQQSEAWRFLSFPFCEDKREDCTMKIANIIAAAALAITGIAGATAASAAPVTVVSAAASIQGHGYRDGQRYRDRNRWDRQDRRWDRGRQYNRGRYYNRGRSYRNNRRACWTEWRRHQGRVTVCRRR
jgi:hypothetical protein